MNCQKSTQGFIVFRPTATKEPKWRWSPASVDLRMDLLGGRYLFPIEILCLWMEKKKRNLSPKAGFQSRYPSGFRQGKKRFFVIFIFELILRLRPLIVLEKRFEIHISWGSSNLPKTSYNDTFGGTAEQPGM